MTRSVRRWALPGLLLLTLTACTADEPSPTASPTTEATPTPTPTVDTAAVEAEVLDVYHRYWDAVVEAQAGNPDPALFADNTTGEQLELELAKAREYAELGIVIEGEPVISETSVDLQDDVTAVVSACVDYTDWVAAEMTGDSVGVVPTSLQLDQVDGAWFVTDYVTAPAGLTC